MLQGQAVVLSYIDLYWILGVITALMFVLFAFLKRNAPGEGGEIPMHINGNLIHPSLLRVPFQGL